MIVPTSLLPFTISRVEYILGAQYVRSVLRRPKTESIQELQDTLRILLAGIVDDQAESEKFPLGYTTRLIGDKMVRVACYCWLLTEVWKVPVYTEDFPVGALLEQPPT